MDDHETQRTIGSLSAKMDHLERGLSDMKRDMDARFKRNDDRLDEVIKTLNQLSGGWKFVMMIGSVIGFIAAFVTASKTGFWK